WRPQGPLPQRPWRRTALDRAWRIPGRVRDPGGGHPPGAAARPRLRACGPRGQPAGCLRGAPGAADSGLESRAVRVGTREVLRRVGTNSLGEGQLKSAAVARWAVAVSTMVAVGLLTAFAAVAFGDDGTIGPSLALLGNGRHLQPAGTPVGLGNFPTGGEVTPNGRFYWTVSSGRGRNDIRIVSLGTKKVVQVVPLPGASGGVAMDPTRTVAYVSGVADSDAGHADQQQPGL